MKDVLLSCSSCKNNTTGSLTLLHLRRLHKEHEKEVDESTFGLLLEDRKWISVTYIYSKLGGRQQQQQQI